MTENHWGLQLENSRSNLTRPPFTALDGKKLTFYARSRDGNAEVYVRGVAGK